MCANEPYAAHGHYNETLMSSSPLQRALWGAALCCALPLAAQAAGAPCNEPWQSIEPWQSVEPWQHAPLLVAAAGDAPALGSALPGGGRGQLTQDINTSSDLLTA